MSVLTVEEALEKILAYVPKLTETEQVLLEEAAGRILAQDMIAEFDNPPFDRSPIDGYACKAEDICGAEKDRPVRLQVLEEVDAGQYSENVVKPGYAVRIMTGAAIPKGCDCCVRQEDTDYGEDVVLIYKQCEVYENYCFHGEDFKQGTCLLPQYTEIGFIETGVLAGMGVSTVQVMKKPRIALLTSGDEVVEPGQKLLPGKIFNSNKALLEARLKEFDVDLVYVEAVPDSEEQMADSLKAAAQKADLIITTGGVSVGKKDIMHGALQKAGAEKVFWKIKMKPGMPTLFSVLNQVPVISMSGNPFGVAVSIEILVRPALFMMYPKSSLKLKYKKGIMQSDFNKGTRGRRYIRAFYEDGKINLPEGKHSNGILASMIGCNCLIDRKEEEGPLAKEAEACVIML